MPFDGEKFGQDVVHAVNDSIERSLAPLMARLDALEALGVRHGVDGKDADMNAVRLMIVEECKDVRAGLESTLGPEMQAAMSVMVAEAVKAIPVPVAPELPDIAGMVAEAVKAIPPARDGKDADPVDIDAIADQVRASIVIPELPEIVIPELPDIAGMVAEAVKAIPVPVAPELPDIAGMVDNAVSKAVEAIPPARDGKDADPVDVDALAEQVRAAVVVPELPDIAGMVAEAVKTIPVPVAPELPDIAGMVADAVKAIPTPKDGTSITVDDVRPLIDEAVSKAVEAIPTPKDGRDGVDAVDCLIDKFGHLVFTFSNGKTKDVGQVVGDDGVDCDFDGVWKLINQKLDSWPKPRDGMGFDDLSMEHDGERTFKFVLARDDERKEFSFTMPVVLDRGVFDEAKTYARGDAVTWAGSSWIAQTDEAKEKPGTGKQWRLSVKRGSNGKDGVMTIPRPNVPVKLGV